MQALTKQEITLFGDGLRTRAFCYVDDMIDGIVRLMATGNAVTGSPSCIAHHARPRDDPKQRRSDISRANEILGWSPKTQLEDSLDFERLSPSTGRR